LSHLHDGLRLGEASRSESAYRARFTTTVKNIWDTMCRQMAFNIIGNHLKIGEPYARRLKKGILRLLEHWIAVEIGYVGHNSDLEVERKSKTW